MSSSASEFVPPPLAAADQVTDEALIVELVHGRALTVPWAWFPCLLDATPADRGAWRLIGHGEGVRWPALDADVSIGGLLAGRGSLESQASLRARCRLTRHGSGQGRYGGRLPIASYRSPCRSLPIR